MKRRWAILVTTTLVLFTAALLLSVMQGPEPAETPASATAVQSDAAKPAEVIRQLNELKSAYRRQKKSGFDKALRSDLEAFVAHEAAYRPERFEAAQMLIDVCYGLGDREASHGAFEALLDELDGARRSGKAQSITLNLGLRRQKRDNDALDALYYFDMLVTRYPKSPLCASAQLGIGRYFLSTESYMEASRTFAELMERYPNSDAAELAWIYKGVALERVGDRDGLRRYFTESLAAGEHSQAYARYQLGLSHYCDGAPGYVKALKEFQLLAKEYPDTRYAGEAKYYIETINRNMTGGILE